MVAAVAALEPETAANRAQEAMLECKRPPGMGDNQFDRIRYMRSAIPLRTRISPIIIKSGTATRIKLLFVFQAICPNISHNGRSEKICISDMPISPNAVATYSPAKKNTVIRIAATSRTMDTLPYLVLSFTLVRLDHRDSPAQARLTPLASASHRAPSAERRPGQGRLSLRG